jgi:hypothetical protein
MATKDLTVPRAKSRHSEAVPPELAEKRQEFKRQELERKKANRERLAGLQANGTWRPKRKTYPKRKGGANLEAWL